MVQNGKTGTPEVKVVKADDIALAAIVSALGTTIPDIMSNKTAKLVGCFAIGVVVGVYGCKHAVKYAKKGSCDNAKPSN